jgi:hypothetical protein
MEEMYKQETYAFPKRKKFNNVKCFYALKRKIHKMHRTLDMFLQACLLSVSPSPPPGFQRKIKSFSYSPLKHNNFMRNDFPCNLKCVLAMRLLHSTASSERQVVTDDNDFEI